MWKEKKNIFLWKECWTISNSKINIYSAKMNSIIFFTIHRRYGIRDIFFSEYFDIFHMLLGEAQSFFNTKISLVTKSIFTYISFNRRMDRKSQIGNWFVSADKYWFTLHHNSIARIGGEERLADDNSIMSCCIWFVTFLRLKSFSIASIFWNLTTSLITFLLVLTWKRNSISLKYFP